MENIYENVTSLSKGVFDCEVSKLKFGMQPRKGNKSIKSDNEKHGVISLELALERTYPYNFGVNY